MCVSVFYPKVNKMNMLLVFLTVFLRGGLTFSIIYETEKNVSSFLLGVDKTVISECKDFVPELSHDQQKGQSGRIGVFGGSIEYSGAPYFGAMGSLRTGADLVYVFCASPAAIAIKSYSPEPMVLPCLDDDDPLEIIKPWLVRLHGVLIGPGLGRHPKVTKNILSIIEFMKTSEMDSIPLVIDADGFYILYKYPEILQSYPGQIYLTPNIVEFMELASVTLGITNKDEIVPEVHLKSVAKKFGKKVTILLKGRNDMIAQGDLQVTSFTEGSPRRCGGQGDLLSGCLTTYAAWVKKSEAVKCGRYTPEMLAAFSASTVIKLSNRMAFEDKGRGLIASDMLAKMNIAFDIVFGNQTLINKMLKYSN